MPIDAKELAQRYVNALTEIGVVAKIDDESDVVFKMPGVGSFYISLDAENDPEFMRLVYPNFYSNKDVGPVLTTINSVNMKKKAVKLWARERDGEHNVSASIESFLAGSNQAPDTALLTATLERCIEAIRVGVASFAKESEGSI